MSGKVAGALLLAAGVVICALVSAFIGAGLAGDQVGAAGAVLGVGLFGVLPLLLLGGGGIYLIFRGRSEEAELAEARKKQRLLGLIQTQGKVELGAIMVELGLTRPQITSMIYDLVSLGLFAGYVDWSSQTFYSADAARVGSTKCPNCGGERELAGKGIVKCPYCGVELFIPPEPAGRL